MAAEIDLDLQIRLSEGPNSLPCEFVANPFSGSGDKSYFIHMEKVTDTAKNRTLRSSLRAGGNCVTFNYESRTLIIGVRLSHKMIIASINCRGEYRKPLRSWPWSYLDI